MLIGIIMGLITFIGMIEIIETKSGLGSYIGYLLVPVFFFFVILVHEMGHAIGAWMVGYRVHIIVVGFLGFDPENITFRRVTETAENEIAGFVSCSPKWPLSGQRWREIWVSFAGPFATILLGLVFLWLDRMYGSHSEEYVHFGYFLLAIVCFVDAGFNLFPRKLGSGINNDGRSILTSLWAPQWDTDNWASYRHSLSQQYNQTFILDKEWMKLRRDAARLAQIDNDNPYWRQFAWIQSDAEAFAVMVEATFPSLKDCPRLLRAQYVASRVLSGRFEPELKALMPDVSKEEEAIYFFAQALLDYGAGDSSAANAAIAKARALYKAGSGTVPADEDRIFQAIENKGPLPPLKWPKMN